MSHVQVHIQGSKCFVRVIDITRVYLSARMLSYCEWREIPMGITYLLIVHAASEEED
jgi:hypothetical protein